MTYSQQELISKISIQSKTQIYLNSFAFLGLKSYCIYYVTAVSRLQTVQSHLISKSGKLAWKVLAVGLLFSFTQACTYLPAHKVQSVFVAFFHVMPYIHENYIDDNYLETDRQLVLWSRGT